MLGQQRIEALVLPRIIVEPKAKQDIGVDADQYAEMPGTVVTSMIKRGDVAVFDIVKATVDGTFHGGMNVFGLKEAGVDYVHDGPHASAIPDDVKAKVEALRSDVIEKRISVSNH